MESRATLGDEDAQWPRAIGLVAHTRVASPAIRRGFSAGFMKISTSNQHKSLLGYLLLLASSTNSESFGWLGNI